MAKRKITKASLSRNPHNPRPPQGNIGTQLKSGPRVTPKMPQVSGKVKVKFI